MNNNLEFKKKCFIELTHFEEEEINGGYVKYIVAYFIDNWDDFKQGLKDGWNSL